MYVSGNAVGGGVMERKFAIGASVVVDQVICIAANAEVGDPASVNDYTEAVGIALEAGTYAGSALGDATMVRCTYSPFQLVRGLCSGGTAADTALAETTDGNLLTATAASATGVLVTDADVGTSEFVSGWLIALSGDNKGRARIISAHSDNTSTTAADGFTNAIAIGDTFVRTFGTGNQGLELTTDFTQFNMKTGAGVDLPDTGHGIVVNMYCDESLVVPDGGIIVKSATAPVIEAEIVFSDHYLNSLA